jgi:hypothetical protein
MRDSDVHVNSHTFTRLPPSPDDENLAGELGLREEPNENGPSHAFS